MGDAAMIARSADASMNETESAADSGSRRARRGSSRWSRRRWPCRRRGRARGCRQSWSSSVLRRWLFSTPIPGDFELAQIGTAVAVFAFLPYCQVVRGNIVVDTFTAQSAGTPARAHRRAVGRRLCRGHGLRRGLPDARHVGHLRLARGLDGAAHSGLAGGRVRRAELRASWRSCRWRPRTACSGARHERHLGRARSASAACWR